VKKPNLCVVTEFVKHGSLREVLANSRTIKLSWGQRLSMLLSAAVGLSYLHSLQPPVVHGDLKSSNLLVEEGMVSVKVSDFGFARLKEDNVTMTRCGTPCWTAPEIIRGQPYSPISFFFFFSFWSHPVCEQK
jgi:serine/threonine protein kinase